MPRALAAVLPAQNSEKQRLASGRPFPKGRSGNPGGRPVVAKGFRERCKAFMDAEGWQKLVALAKSPTRDQLAALTLIASYAYGKPTQPISGPDDGPIEVRAIDYRAAIAPIAFRSDEDSAASGEN